MPASTSPEKVELIEFYGGRCHFVERSGQIYGEAKRLAEETGGHYMDQFTYAERATDWRGNNNIAESIFEQLALEQHPVPTWIVVGAGTGGTSATIGRYVRYQRHETCVAVVDPENSAFFPAFESGDGDFATGRPSRIEGIGRPRVEPSFVLGVVDRMIARARRRVDRRDAVLLARSPAGWSAAPPAPTCGDPCGWRRRCGVPGVRGQHRHAAVRRRRALRATRTTTTAGCRHTASTSRRTWTRWSASPSTGRWREPVR